MRIIPAENAVQVPSFTGGVKSGSSLNQEGGEYNVAKNMTDDTTVYDNTGKAGFE